jgi:membrane-associated phospholipid phosphatase
MRSLLYCIVTLLGLQLLQTKVLALVATRQLTNHSNASNSVPRPTSRVKASIPSSSLYSLLENSRDGAIDMTSASSSIQSRRILQQTLFAANAATKWLVSIAVTIGVFWNPFHFRGPYIVTGSIIAIVLANALKRFINQERPDGAPFTDPGMPSSHALVSFFVATAWLTAFKGTHAPLLLGSAALVSLLRVICGYHTIPQIAVGGILGTILGHGWMHLGSFLASKNYTVTMTFAWSTYLIGSAIYVKKNARKWLSEEKYL